MKIYTKSGDAGETALIGGPRVRKDHVRIEAYGTIDELNSFLGVARASWPDAPFDAELHDIQSDLFDIGAQLATPVADSRFPGVGEERVEALERLIDQLEGELTPLKNFILPGGTAAAANFHVARTVCRRAERLAVALQDRSTSATLRYLNRLSDLLFVMARYANHRAGRPDVPWVGIRGAR
jgi:cob(I)alamin adenosyltransferase